MNLVVAVRADLHDVAPDVAVRGYDPVDARCQFAVAADGTRKRAEQGSEGASTLALVAETPAFWVGRSAVNATGEIHDHARSVSSPDFAVPAARSRLCGVAATNLPRDRRAAIDAGGAARRRDVLIHPARTAQDGAGIGKRDTALLTSGLRSRICQETRSATNCVAVRRRATVTTCSHVYSVAQARA